MSKGAYSLVGLLVFVGNLSAQEPPGIEVGNGHHRVSRMGQQTVIEIKGIGKEGQQHVFKFGKDKVEIVIKQGDKKSTTYVLGKDKVKVAVLIRGEEKFLDLDKDGVEVRNGKGEKLVAANLPIDEGKNKDEKAAELAVEGQKIVVTLK